MLQLENGLNIQLASVLVGNDETPWYDNFTQVIFILLCHQAFVVSIHALGQIPCWAITYTNWENILLIIPVAVTWSIHPPFSLWSVLINNWILRALGNIEKLRGISELLLSFCVYILTFLMMMTPGVDSFYEYLLKAHILFGGDEYWDMFQCAYIAVQKYFRYGPWFVYLICFLHVVVKCSRHPILPS